jgi:hypothetical protein
MPFNRSGEQERRMDSKTIEKDWTTEAGFRAVVLMTSMGHRCGYVAVPVGHQLHGVKYSEPCAHLKPPADDEEVGKRSPLALICAAGDESRMQSPDIVFNVHGGLTYSGGSAEYPAASDGLWWFGYDCAHYGDAKSPEYCAQSRERYPDNPILWDSEYDGEYRDLDYCVAECESLARQIKEAVAVPA